MAIIPAPLASEQESGRPTDHKTEANWRGICGGTMDGLLRTRIRQAA